MLGTGQLIDILVVSKSEGQLASVDQPKSEPENLARIPLFKTFI